MRAKNVIIFISWIILIGFIHVAHADMVQYAWQDEVCYYRVDNKLGLMNSDHVLLTEAIYDIAYPFVDDVAVVAQNGKYGLIDRLGKNLLPFEFADITPGKYGIITSKDGQYGVWNFSGENIIPNEYDLIYENGPTFVTMLDESYGLFSLEGNMLIPCVMGGIGTYHSSWIRIVGEDYKVNYINQTGAYLLSSDVDYGTDFSLNYAAYASDGIIYIVDINGRISATDFLDVDLFPFMDMFIITCADGSKALFDAKQNAIYSLPGNIYGVFSENKLAFSENNLWGFCDFSGNVIIPAQYDWVYPYSNGVACVQYNNKWFYINHMGDSICSQTFDEAYSFSEGLAACVDNDTNLTGFINTNGEWHISPQYESLGSVSFCKDLCTLYGADPYENTIINTSGEIVSQYYVPLEYFQ